MAYTAAEEKWQLYTDSIKNVFDTAYYNKCMKVKQLESFTVNYNNSEYHYTLYYYDQAGNLVKTIPPKGVDAKHGDAPFLAQVKAARLNVKNGQTEALNKVVPNHTMATQYRYNTLNQPIGQQTTDGGQTKFWYDALGRLVVSQNAQQALDKKYSYTLYDSIGRPKEVGQLTQAIAMTPAIAQNPVSLANWLKNQAAEQITRTFYDKTYFEGTDILCSGLLCQKNLRNRVSFTATYATGTPGVAIAGTHDMATYFSYDIKGGVDTILQDYNSGVMKAANNRFKKLVYEYDLISGKVNKVSYQPGWQDQFFHKYLYDAENRLTDVLVSRDDKNWYNHARYSYYKHGSLSREIIGTQQVLGNDYAYTIQGWLKGMNATSVGDGKWDMGGDGVKNGNVVNQVAGDAFGFSLNYFNNDYKAIKNTLIPFTPIPNIAGLYNGNMAAISMNIPILGDALLGTYQYDQLNRLTEVNNYKGLNNATNTWTPIAINDFKEALSYDANGNIQTYKRNGFDNNINLNNYSYTYQANTNKLASITNAVDNTVSAYGYDAIGNVIKDEKQEVVNNIWNVYGKLQKVEKKDGKIITYSYDASGNRLSKVVGDTTEIYVRDAAGNVLITYQQNPKVNGGNLSIKEFSEYGSNLLGVYEDPIDIHILQPAAPVIPMNDWKNKFYAYGSNGNIIGSVSGVKLQQDDDNDGMVDRYSSQVKTATFFSAYGAMSKSLNGDSLPRAFNGQQRSPEISLTAQTAEFWEYNGDVGRRWNTEPLKDAPHNIGISPYAVMRNNPVLFSDPDGQDAIVSIIKNKDGSTTLKVKTIVHITGSTEPERIKGYSKDVKERFKDQQVSIEGNVWNIQYDIQYVYDQAFDASKMKEGENVLEVTNRVAMTGSNRTRVNPRNNQGLIAVDHAKYPEVISHETGHLIGL